MLFRLLITKQPGYCRCIVFSPLDPSHWTCATSAFIKRCVSLSLSSVTEPLLVKCGTFAQATLTKCALQITETFAPDSRKRPEDQLIFSRVNQHHSGTHDHDQLFAPRRLHRPAQRRQRRLRLSISSLPPLLRMHRPRELSGHYEDLVLEPLEPLTTTNSLDCASSSLEATFRLISSLTDCVVLPSPGHALGTLHGHLLGSVPCCRHPVPKTVRLGVPENSTTSILR